MIVNIIFHGAWLFVISEAKGRLFAYSPVEDDHFYAVGSVTANTQEDLPKGDYELKGISGTDTVWYPNADYTPLVSAKRQSLKAVDPRNFRHCCISLPFPQPANIFPLEPYNTVGFLKGTATSEFKNLQQLPAVHAFLYKCKSLSDVRFSSSDGDIIPKIPTNEPPYQETANLHVFATYWSLQLSTEDDRAQMERCFHDMTKKLLDPGLNLELKIDPNFKIERLAYALPPGVSRDEVELIKTGRIGPLYGGSNNCQNTTLFLYETDWIRLPHDKG